MKRGDITEKEPLYVVTGQEDMDPKKYYDEIDIDGETYSKFSSQAKSFVLRFIKDNYAKRIQSIGENEDENRASDSDD